MNYYYLLESGEPTTSKWEKQVGEVHRDSKIKFVLTEEQYIAVVQEINRQTRTKNRKARKDMDLWLANLIMKAAETVAGFDAKHQGHE